MNKHKRIIGYVFSYDELNTNVFYNALLWNSKDRSDIHAVAYAPKGFLKLFFEFDEVIEIPEKFTNASKFGLKHSETIAHPLREKIIQFRHHQTLKFLNKFPDFTHLAVTHPRLLATYRQASPLYKSGVFKWAKRDLTKRHGKRGTTITTVSNFIIPKEFGGASLAYPQLGEAYQYLFTQMFQAISSGMVLSLSDTTTNRKPLEHIALRTRNFKKKAVEHNSDPTDTQRTLDTVLRAGFSVVNYGAPPLPLTPKDFPTNYNEAFLGSIDEELESITHKVLLRADAGLFVLFACTDFSLAAMSPEWSLNLGVELFEARKIRDEVNSTDLLFPKYSEDLELIAWLNS